MEAVTLSDLWPIIVAVLGPMLLCVTALARYQHLDNAKIHRLISDSNEKNRDLIKETRDETRDLIEKSSQENRRLIEKSSQENRRLIEKNRDLLAASHAELSGSLADARERLARIEGHLRISPPPYQGAGDGNAEAA